jgi:hypothetical protein
MTVLPSGAAATEVPKDKQEIMTIAAQRDGATARRRASADVMTNHCRKPTEFMLFIVAKLACQCRESALMWANFRSGV